jgi:ribosomal protein L11 methyltransferase
LIRLAVRCRAELAEGVLAELVELAPGGVEEEAGPEWVEYAIYGAPGELPALPALEAAAGAGLVEVTSREVPDDWAERWQDFHRAVSIAGGRILVRPSWDPRPASDPAGIDVVVDPGQAFGTGAHPTTRMCLELLLDLADAGLAAGPLVDLGTGSGVLAIAAAKLGFEPVIACDREHAALAAAAANAGANGVDVELVSADLRTEPAPRASTVTANLTAPLLVEVAMRMSAPRRLICSGMLLAEADDVREAFATRGLAERRQHSAGDWAALLLARD